jgi:allophanate hydrolase
MDAARLRLANALAGNPEGAPALEFYLSGPTLAATDAPVRIAVAGDVPLTLQRGADRVALPPWRSLTLQPGEVLRVGTLRSGRLGYVAVAGLAVAPVLGSASTYVRAALGGVAGRPLAAGDRLAVAVPEPGSPERQLPQPPAAASALDAPIRVVPGPQDDHFDADAMAAFLGSTWQISREADRMGTRLEGTPLRHRPDKGAEVVSDAAVPGSVQVPGNGLPIVLLADGQTAGGYPKIATVVSADRGRLADLPVGAPLRFAAVTVADAEALARAHEAALQALLASVQPLTLVDGIDLSALYGGNLVSAVVDALRPET